MRKFYILMLMLVLPLQSLWAAGQVYHALEDGHGTSVVALAHTHNHDHDHSHDHYHSNSDSSSSESDHHHHCTGHGAMVLPGLLSNPQPDLRYDEYSPEPILATSHLNSRIERPNWC